MNESYYTPTLRVPPRETQWRCLVRVSSVIGSDCIVSSVMGSDCIVDMSESASQGSRVEMLSESVLCDEV